MASLMQGIDMYLFVNISTLPGYAHAHSIEDGGILAPNS